MNPYQRQFETTVQGVQQSPAFTRPETTLDPFAGSSQTGVGQVAGPPAQGLWGFNPPPQPDQGQIEAKFPSAPQQSTAFTGRQEAASQVPSQTVEATHMPGPPAQGLWGFNPPPQPDQGQIEAKLPSAPQQSTAFTGRQEAPVDPFLAKAASQVPSQTVEATHMPGPPAQGLWGFNPPPQLDQGQIEAKFPSAPQQSTAFTGRQEAVVDPVPAKVVGQVPLEHNGFGTGHIEQQAMPLTQPMHGLCQPAQSFPVHQGGQALLSTQVQAPPSFGQANPMSFASHTGSQAGQQPFGGVPAPPPSQFREPQALAFEPAVFGGSQVQAQPQRTESGLAHGFGQFPAQSQYGTIPEGNQHLFAQGQQPPQPFGVPSFSPVAQMDQSHFQFPMNSPDSRNCSCGQPALLLNVKKEGPNQGRGFWKCAKQNPEQPCGFFEWADEPPRSSGNGANGHGANGHSQAQGMMPQLPPGPACTCGQPSLGLTVKKDGPNKGRVFFKCAQGQCGHFQWADQEPDPPGPPCSCGVPSVRRTVQKEGPNRGRPFMICVKRGCDFFAWGDEEPKNGPTPTPVRAGGMARSQGDVCFSCNQPGHWASNCPNKAQGAPKGRGKGRGRGRGRKKAVEEDFDFPSDDRYMPY